MNKFTKVWIKNKFNKFFISIPTIKAYINKKNSALGKIMFKKWNNGLKYEIIIIRTNEMQYAAVSRRNIKTVTNRNNNANLKIFREIFP